MESSNTPLISLVTVTWNGKEYAREYLESIAASGAAGVEIIIVDNASTDGTPEFIAEHYPGVRLIRNTANLGFAKGSNIGIEASTGRYVCLVNSDVVLHPGCLEQLVAVLELPENRDVGVIGPQMLGVHGEVRRSTMRYPTLTNAIFRAAGLDQVPALSRLCKGQLVTDFGHDAAADVEVLNGWFLLLRREALEQVGLLDERFFMYGEDMDWCIRFRKRGWRLLFYPHAKALHYGGASSSAAPDRFYVEMQRANLQYWRKHHVYLSYCLYYGVVCVHHLLRVLGHYGMSCLRWSQFTGQASKAKRSWIALSQLLDPRNSRMSTTH